MVADIKTFGLKNADACIQGRKNKDKYMEYQDEYRKQYGVFPELDRINNPFTAKWDDVYEMFCAYRKNSVYSALWTHDLSVFFKKGLKKIYESYSKEWSFLLSVGLENRTLFNDIRNMQPGEQIANNLGYRVDENGNYFEGTWQDGKLIYGLVYLSNIEVYYVGSFDESGITNSSGVGVNWAEDQSGKAVVTAIAGNFRKKNDKFDLYEADGMEVDTYSENGNLAGAEVTIGKYNEGYREGFHL